MALTCSNKTCFKTIGDYYDFYVQSDKFLLADVFRNLRNMCLQIYELDPVNFSSVQDYHGNQI